MQTEQNKIVFSGIIIGVIASLLVYFGNPINMGFCIACFLRDIAGALGLHRASAVQYIRPEITGLVLGSFMASTFHKEYSSRGGSAALVRFLLGFCVMIGSLMFLGCPFRMIIRLAGGDLNAITGLVGFVSGICIGVFFLNRGYSLGRTYRQTNNEGIAFLVLQIVLLILLFAAPVFIFFTKTAGALGGKHAAVIISLFAGMFVGYLAQRTRLCMVGAFRDFILFRDSKLFKGFFAVFVGCIACNLLLTMITGTDYYKIGFVGQSIAHTEFFWNFAGMMLTGLSCVLIGGCPLRQLIMAGEGNSDSALTVIGLTAGAAFAHNFGLASSTAGPTVNGKISVVIAFIVVLFIAYTNTFRK